MSGRLIEGLFKFDENKKATCILSREAAKSLGDLNDDNLPEDDGSPIVLHFGGDEEPWMETLDTYTENDK